MSSTTRTLTALLLGLMLLHAAACSDDTSEAGADVTPDTADDQAGEPEVAPPGLDELAADAVSAVRLRTHIDTLAADDTYGRMTGSPGHLAARDYVVAEMTDIGLEPFGDEGSYLHEYATTPSRGRYQRQANGDIIENDATVGWNVVGLLRGTEATAADEYVVVMGHYDHLGVSENGSEIFNGAFDDASGTAAVLEMARAIVEAEATPRRSIVFLVTDQEEHGLTGADAWLDDEVVAPESIVAGISADPVGRGLLPDYGPIVLLGTEHSAALLEFIRPTAAFTERDLGFLHRGMIPVFASDQDRFYERGLPAIWLTSPGMSFYHESTDDPETIDYAVLRDVTRYFTRTTLLLANTEERFTFDGEPEVRPADAADALPILEGVLTSSFLGNSERRTVEGYIADLNQVIANDDWSVIGNPTLYFGQVLSFVAFALPISHPGEIPPPFPEE